VIYHNNYPIPARYLTPEAKTKHKHTDARLRIFSDLWTGLSGAVLLGPSGCGKTLTAAISGARQRVLHNESWVYWIRADELTRALSVRGGAEEVEAIKSARVLIIDELGYERWPELVLEVIGARHDWNRPTVVTSGMKLDKLTERYSDATIRRITEVGNGSVFSCW
jgi:DNA replication protein DnaC